MHVSPLRKYASIFIGGLLLLSFTPVPVMAQSPSAYAMRLALGMQDMDFREYGMNGVELDREVGWLKHVAVAAEGPLAHRLRWFAEAERSDGAVDYIGQSQSGVPSETTTDEDFQAWRIGTLWQPAAGPSAIVLAVGQTRWQRMIRANTVTGALNEYYQWYSATLGLQSELTIADQVLSLGGGYTRLMQGRMQVDFSDYGYGKANVGLATGHRWWLEAAFPVLRLADSVLSVTYQWTYEYADRSANAKAGTLTVYEPESRAIMQRYALEWRITF